MIVVAIKTKLIYPKDQPCFPFLSSKNEETQILSSGGPPDISNLRRQNKTAEVL